MFDKFPTLKIIAGHWGETILPYFNVSADFLTLEQKELIAHKNAERILHIKGKN